MKPTILLIEDRPDDRYLLRWLLRDFDAGIIEATKGEAALAAVAAHMPQVAVLDLGLPDMDGLELLRRLRALPGGGALPIVAVTARALPEERDLAMAAGCNAYVAKPVDPGTLRAIVGSLLERSKGVADA